MPRYVELECPECTERWEVYVRFLEYEPGDYDMVAVPDSPDGYCGRLICERCGGQGERI